MSINEQKKQRLARCFVITAEGRTRTGTTDGHYPLKIACLPVPPLRQFVSCVLMIYEGSSCFSVSDNVLSDDSVTGKSGLGKSEAFSKGV